MSSGSPAEKMQRSKLAQRRQAATLYEKTSAARGAVDTGLEDIVACVPSSDAWDCNCARSKFRLPSGAGSGSRGAIKIAPREARTVQSKRICLSRRACDAGNCGRSEFKIITVGQVRAKAASYRAVLECEARIPTDAVAAAKTFDLRPDATAAEIM